MPDLDVSWVLEDAELSDSFWVIRTPTLRNGLPDTANQQMMHLSGVLVAGAQENIILVEDSSRSVRTLKIRCPTRLFDVVVGYQPDIVIYLGNRWKVMRPFDYSRFGAGFYGYECDMLDLQSAFDTSPAADAALAAAGAGYTP